MSSGSHERPIRSPARWTSHRPEGNTTWAGRLRLIDGLVVGQWYARDRRDGSVVWDVPIPHVNAIAGAHEGIVLAYELVPGRRPGRHAAAVRLADGAVLWSKRLTPTAVEGPLFTCLDGSVRDLESGRIFSRAQRPARFAEPDLAGPTWALLVTSWQGLPVRVATDTFVTCDASGEQYRGVSGDGSLRWRLSTTELGWWGKQSIGELKLCAPFLFFLATRERPYVYTSVKTIQYIPCRRHLLVVDGRSGEVVQDLDLGVWTGAPSLDVDEQGVVVRLDDTQLAYFERAPGLSSCSRRAMQ